MAAHIRVVEKDNVPHPATLDLAYDGPNKKGTMSLQPGTRLGPYEILAPLGAGGMGEVWKAKDTRLDRFVAVKVLPEHLAKHPESLARFEREAKAVAALNHPNITGIHDFATEGDTIYVVMELLEGESLRTRLESGPLPPRKATELAIQMAQGLAAAHEKGVVHRDLKPDNLWITKEGRLKILDFGLAKQITGMGVGSDSFQPTAAISPGHHTEKGMILGTLGYMSPEQVRGEAVDARSDIFSFGVVLFEMLTGKKAFARDTASDTMAAILRDDPPELEGTSRPLLPGLKRVLDHCLEKEPGARFQNAGDLAFDLGNASEISGPQRPGLLRARTMKWVASGGVLVIVALMGLSYWAGQGRRIPPPTFKVLSVGDDAVVAARFLRGGPSVVFATFSRDNSRTTKAIHLVEPGNPVIHDLLGSDAYLLSASPSGELAVLTRHTKNMRLDVPIGSLGRCPPGGSLPKLMDQDILDADWGPDGKLAVVRRVGGGGASGFYGCRLEYPVGHALLVEPRGWLRHPRFSPDGKFLAIERHPDEADDLGTVAVVVLGSGTLRDLTPTYSTLRGLAWHPRTNEIWYTAQEVGVQQDLFAVSIGGMVRSIYHAPVGIYVQDIGADGKVLLCSDERGARSLVKRPQDSAPRSLGMSSWSMPVDMSRDGKWIVVDDETLGRGPDYPQFLRPTDGSLPTQLGMGYFTSSLFSPDGKRLCIWRREGDHWKHSMVTLNGGEEAWPTGDLDLPSPPVYGWEGTESLIVWAKAPKGEARFWRLNENGPVPLDLPKPPLAPSRILVPSRPGSRLFCGTRKGWFSMELQKPGEPPRPCAGVTEKDFLIGLSGDGTLAYCQVLTNGTCWKVNLQSGARMPMDVPKELGEASAISEDGKTLLGSDFPISSRLFLVEGLK